MVLALRVDAENAVDVTENLDDGSALDTNGLAGLRHLDPRTGRTRDDDAELVCNETSYPDALARFEVVLRYAVDLPPGGAVDLRRSTRAAVIPYPYLPE